MIEDKKLPLQKADIYSTYDNLLKVLKKTLIKTLIQEINANLGYADRISPAVFNENLWNLDYKINLITNNKEVEVLNPTLNSPFSTIMELARDFPFDQKDVKNVEVVFNMKSTFSSERLPDPFDQLGLYRYADSSTEWLRCKIKYKFQYDIEGTQASFIGNEIDGFGVIFERFPKGRFKFLNNF